MADSSTDTKELVRRIESEVSSSPRLIGRRVINVDDTEEEMVAGPPEKEFSCVRRLSTRIMFSKISSFRAKNFEFQSLQFRVSEPPINPSKRRRRTRM